MWLRLRSTCRIDYIIHLWCCLESTHYCWYWSSWNNRWDPTDRVRKIEMHNRSSSSLSDTNSVHSSARANLRQLHSNIDFELRYHPSRPISCKPSHFMQRDFSERPSHSQSFRRRQHYFHRHKSPMVFAWKLGLSQILGCLNYGLCASGFNINHFGLPDFSIR